MIPKVVGVLETQVVSRLTRSVGAPKPRARKMKKAKTERIFDKAIVTI